jgi:hypothetical protein
MKSMEAALHTSCKIEITLQFLSHHTFTNIFLLGTAQEKNFVLKLPKKEKCPSAQKMIQF